MPSWGWEQSITFALSKKIGQAKRNLRILFCCCFRGHLHGTWKSLERPCDIAGGCEGTSHFRWKPAGQMSWLAVGLGRVVSSASSSTISSARVPSLHRTHFSIFSHAGFALFFEEGSAELQHSAPSFCCFSLFISEASGLPFYWRMLEAVCDRIVERKLHISVASFCFESSQSIWILFSGWPSGILFSGILFSGWPSEHPDCFF